MTLVALRDDVVVGDDIAVSRDRKARTGGDELAALRARSPRPGTVAVRRAAELLEEFAERIVFAADPGCSG